MTGSAPSPARRAGWDLLRSAFVLMVVLYHSTSLGPLVYHEFVPRTFVFGHQIGASLLLALSAYFVAATIDRIEGADRLARWWWAKIARLLPPFVVATAVAWTALRFLAPPGMFHPGVYQLVANEFMLWNWNGVRHWEYVDGSYWTIPLQLMAFTAAAVLRRTGLGRGRALRALMWAVLVATTLQWPLRDALGPLYTSIVDGLGLHRWHLFVAGVAVWMVSTGRLHVAHATSLLSACVLAHALQIGALGVDGHFTTDWWSVLGLAAGLLAMVLAANGPDVVAVLPRVVTRGVTWLAANSYGVFLAHQTLGYVVMIRLQEWFGVGPGLQTVAMVVNGVFWGWLCTRWVERPARRALVRAWDRRAGTVPRRRGVSRLASPYPSTPSPVRPEHHDQGRARRWSSRSLRRRVMGSGTAGAGLLGRAAVPGPPDVTGETTSVRGRTVAAR